MISTRISMADGQGRNRKIFQRGGAKSLCRHFSRRDFRFFLVEISILVDPLKGFTRFLKVKRKKGRYSVLFTLKFLIFLLSVFIFSIFPPSLVHLVHFSSFSSSFSTFFLFSLPHLSRFVTKKFPVESLEGGGGRGRSPPPRLLRHCRWNRNFDVYK